MENSAVKKLYYSISEISKMAGIEPHVLRYWEDEFSLLRPEKGNAGRRMYRQKDLGTILRIKKLLYEDKYTIAGAKKVLRGSTGKKEGKKNENTTLLLRLKKELEDIREILK